MVFRKYSLMHCAYWPDLVSLCICRYTLCWCASGAPSCTGTSCCGGQSAFLLRGGTIQRWVSRLWALLSLWILSDRNTVNRMGLEPLTIKHKCNVVLPAFTSCFTLMGTLAMVASPPIKASLTWMRRPVLLLLVLCFWLYLSWAALTFLCLSTSYILWFCLSYWLSDSLSLPHCLTPPLSLCRMYNVSALIHSHRPRGQLSPQQSCGDTAIGHSLRIWHEPVQVWYSTTLL